MKEEDSSLPFLSPKTNAPHTLIAGSTGSGKSVLMQNIILGIACTNRPEQARIVLIDPKLGVDSFAFEGLPHLQGGIISEQEAAILALNELVGEMHRTREKVLALTIRMPLTIQFQIVTDELAPGFRGSGASCITGSHTRTVS